MSTNKEIRVLVFGGSSLIGQHMKECIPANVGAIFFRRDKEKQCNSGTDREGRYQSNWYEIADVTSGIERHMLIARYNPDVVINLAQMSNLVLVNQYPNYYHDLNCTAPFRLSRQCAILGVHYIHVSTHYVFDGRNAPYAGSKNHPTKITNTPLSEYGRQKLEAEKRIAETGNHWTIVRVPEVLGLERPGFRKSSFTSMLETPKSTIKASAKLFSIGFANQIAEQLWMLASVRPMAAAIHLGMAGSVSWLQIARLVSEFLPAYLRKHVEQGEEDAISRFIPKNTTWKHETVPLLKRHVTVPEEQEVLAQLASVELMAPYVESYETFYRSLRDLTDTWLCGLKTAQFSPSES